MTILSKYILSSSACSLQVYAVTKCIFALSAYCPRMHILHILHSIAKCKISQSYQNLSKCIQSSDAYSVANTYCRRVHVLSKCMLSPSACYSYIQVHASCQLMHTRSCRILPDALLFIVIECIFRSRMYAVIKCILSPGAYSVKQRIVMDCIFS